MIGQTVSHYVVVEKLGGGGMGVVYKARDSKLDRFVALKFLSSHLLGHEAARKRFVTEARAASALDHPNIATVHAIEETPDGDVFIVMAHYDGETLAQRLARGPMPVAQVLDVAIQAGEGLARAHAQGIVHRDVKPANLMLTGGGLVKVLDFGLAKVADVRLTDAGSTVGTPAYMSPEQARGVQVDHRTDVWSLGVTLYEMLAGRLPFDGDQRQEVLDAIFRTEPPPLRLAAGAPPELGLIVSRALAKTAADRHPSMAGMVRALRDARGDAPGPSSLETAAHLEARSSAPGAPLTQASGERRQVTVMTADLCDFLALSESLEPEALHARLGAWQQAGAAAVSVLGGHLVASEEGRLVAYFGYPMAHEDDAQRAVRAGRQIAGALRRSSAGDQAREPTLKTRVGLHTGLVVTGNGAGSSALVGNVAAIAGRLAEMAAPGEVVASAETRRLLEGVFETESLGEHTLPGLSRPIGVHRVVRGSGTSRVEAGLRSGLTPLVGRDQEVGLLLARWEHAKEGLGQVALLAGEPGIGKSRLLLEVRERLRQEPHLRLECHGSPYHSDDALHPVVEMLARVAGFTEDDDPPQRLARLEAALGPWGASPETLALLAVAMSLSLPDSHPVLALSPQKRKQKTVEALVQLVLAAAARQPLLLALEDLHWLDPSTQELLETLVPACASAPVLVLATARPGLSASWAGLDHVTRIVLGRLPKKQTEGLIALVAGAAALSSQVLEQIAGRTDGVPLFVEELTRALMESKDPRGESIPATLQESLAARLDRLGSAKGIAQLAAVLGREFPLRWLEAVAPVEPAALRRELSCLLDAGILQPRGAAPAASYAFKHALVQEAAYSSLLKSTRQQYHARIAQALAEHFPETAAGEPHLLAHHYAEAGLTEPAIACWTKAAERAAARFANREAVAAYQRALALLESLPPGPERDGRELGLRMGVCAILPSIFGFAAPETEQAWLRAQELCDGFGPTNQLFWVYHGLWAFHFVRARLEQAHSRAESLLSLGQSRGDSLSLLDGHYALGVTLAFQGEVSASLDHLERGIAADAADPNRSASFMPGMEPGITAPAYSVMPLWLLGRADAALARAEQAALRARGLGHPLTLAFALNYVAWIRLHRGEAARARERAEELTTLSEEHGLFFGPLGQTLLGWALDQNADIVPAWFAGMPAAAPLSEDGLERVAGGLRFYRATGSLVNLSQMLSLLALGQASRGRFAEARATVDEALAFGAETGESWWTAELHRLAGELRLASAPDAAALQTARLEAGAAFTQALGIARGQGAPALELRAATSLARLLRATGRGGEARRVLSASLSVFTEGLATGDLQAARALLDESESGLSG